MKNGTCRRIRQNRDGAEGSICSLRATFRIHASNLIHAIERRSALRAHCIATSHVHSNASVGASVVRSNQQTMFLPCNRSFVEGYVSQERDPIGCKRSTAPGSHVLPTGMENAYPRIARSERIGSGARHKSVSSYVACRGEAPSDGRCSHKGCHEYERPSVDG